MRDPFGHRSAFTDALSRASEALDQGECALAFKRGVEAEYHARMSSSKEYPVEWRDPQAKEHKRKARELLREIDKRCAVRGRRAYA